MDLYALNNFSSQHWQNVEIGASMLIEKKNEKVRPELDLTKLLCAFIA
jgi:hypothetical protein